MNQWGQARTRIEAEVQRKKEHLNTATNFERARGFVRTDWKSKNFDPHSDPTVLDSSTDDSEIEMREKQERDDKVSELDDYSSPIVKKKPLSPKHSKVISIDEQSPSSKPQASI
jgi:hypothetical protein